MAGLTLSSRQPAAIFVGTGKLDISRVHKKIAEARLFLNDLTKQEQRIIGDKEPFDCYLSAFLSAGNSVRDGFQARQICACNKEIKAWRESWEQALTSEDRILYEFMRDDRSQEVHVPAAAWGKRGLISPSASTA